MSDIIEILKQIGILLKELNLLSVTVRVMLAVICGGIIGAERGRAHQPAGMRTYMLVCLGAAIVMSTGQYMYDTFGAGDPSRLGAQVISGIGFLGAGSIIISGKTKVRGLTTAAGLWTSASIGLAIGIGFYSAGIIGTVVVYLIMTQFKKVEYSMLVDSTCYGLYIEFSKEVTVAVLTEKILNLGMEIEEVQINKKGKKFQRAVIHVKSNSNEGREFIQKQIEQIAGVGYVKYIY